MDMLSTTEVTGVKCIILYIIKVFIVHISDLHKQSYHFQAKILIILYVTTVHVNVTEFYSLTIPFLVKASCVNLKVLQYHLQLNIEQFYGPMSTTCVIP